MKSPHSPGRSQRRLKLPATSLDSGEAWLVDYIRMSAHPPIPSLTGLRFVAASCVVVSHALLQIVRFPSDDPLWYTYLTQLSGIGMTLFFVLSGFVIHYNYAASIQKNKIYGLIDFFVARFARLYPLYFLCLICSLCATWWKSDGHLLTEPLPYYLLMMQAWNYVVIGDHNLIYQYGLVLPVTWSISTEWLFYVAYPLICFLVLRLPGYRSRLAAGAAFSAVVYCAMFFVFIHYKTIDRLAVAAFGPVAGIEDHWQDCFIRWLVYFSPYSRITEFIIGCLTAAIFMDLHDKNVTQTERKVGAVVLVMALVGVGGLYRAMFGPPYSGPPFKFVTFLHLSFGFAPLVAIVIFCCARYRTWLTTVLSTPSIVRCGEISYSLYLLHIVVIRAYIVVAVPATHLSQEILDLAYMSAAFLTTIALSLASYRLWESPARRVIRSALTFRSGHATPWSSSAGRLTYPPKERP